MEKWIFILGALLILTGCSRSKTVILGINASPIVIEDTGGTEYSKEKSMYINEDMKGIIQEINDLREKYKYHIDERGFDSLYIDTYEEDYRRIKNVDFSNRSIYSQEYFYDIVDILDKTIAEGLKDYVLDMNNKDLPGNIIIEKVGRTVVYVENSGEKNNYISIKINFLDIEDEFYREVFGRISDEKYILDNVIIGEKLNLIDFTNANQFYNYNYHNVKDANIRYNIFFKDENIEKVNILMRGESGVEFKDDDIIVFINLLNSLDLKGEEKDQLINEYKNIFETKATNKKISLDNYDINIKYNIGRTYPGDNGNFIYFSIERN